MLPLAKVGAVGVWYDQRYRRAIDMLDRDDLNEVGNEHKLPLITMVERGSNLFSRAICLKKELA